MVSELETTFEGPRGDALVEHVAGLLPVVGLLLAADSQASVKPATATEIR
jgi:hypothetical protein